MTETVSLPNEAVGSLLDAIVRLETADEARAFFRDLCTLGELHDLAQRWAVVRLLDQGLHYVEISTLTGASTATITRIAQWLHHGEGGYLRALEKMRSSSPTATGTSTPLVSVSGSTAAAHARANGLAR
jgi:TrpR-related protein YerC/YecD